MLVTAPPEVRIPTPVMSICRLSGRACADAPPPAASDTATATKAPAQLRTAAPLFGPPPGEAGTARCACQAQEPAIKGAGLAHNTTHTRERAHGQSGPLARRPGPR